MGKDESAGMIEHKKLTRLSISNPTHGGHNKNCHRTQNSIVAKEQLLF